MKLSTASDFFESLLAETDHKSEIKIYNNFIGLLTELKTRELTKEQLASIEEQLDLLNLEASPENRKRFYRGKLAEFKQYLKDQFSLISEGYYTAIGLALGLCFGVAFGSAFDVGTGLVLGMVIGMAIGAVMDAKAKKENRVLNVKSK